MSEEPGSYWRLFCIWCLPSIVVPLIVVFCSMAWPLSLVLVFGFLTWIGRTCLSGSDAEAAPSWGDVALYVLVQVIWIPLFLSAIVWGFCSLSGMGNLK
jgi:hypothetical protein